jgi:hypothetical protein
MGLDQPGHGLKMDVGQGPGQFKGSRQVVVCFLLPTGAPSKLKAGRQLAKVRPGACRKVVGDAIDPLKPASRRLAGLESVQRYDPIDVY